MISTILTSVQAMASDDYVGFTFFVGCMAMMAASAFFFLSMSSVEGKWKTSLLVSGLITFIAAVHYFYMRDYWAVVGESPTFFRYVDWTLTVPSDVRGILPHFEGCRCQDRPLVEAHLRFCGHVGDWLLR